MGLQKLENEPLRLSMEADRLNGELEALVMDNYRVFVENLTTGATLRNEDRKIEEHITLLNASLSHLTSSCDSFTDRAMGFLNTHKRNRKTLEHHIQLVELLEIPQLVDACARNQFYEEALELANFANGLERRHLLASTFSRDSNNNDNGNNGNSISDNDNSGEVKKGNSVITSIVDSVHKTLGSLRVQLFNSLTENISLPKELEILGTLRKLNGLLIDRQLSLEKHANDKISALNEEQRDQMRQHLVRSSETLLQMEYLEARTAAIEKSIDNIQSFTGTSISSNSNSEPVLALRTAPSSSSDKTLDSFGVGMDGSMGIGLQGRLLEAIEIQRSMWFTTIKNFGALFGTGKEEEKNKTSSSQSPDIVISAWVTQMVTRFQRDLVTALPKVEEGSGLRAILEQTLYFCDRLGQVGCDFTQVVLPLFEKVQLDKLTMTLEQATNTFGGLLGTEIVTTVVEGMSKELRVPSFVRSYSQSSVSATPKISTGVISTTPPSDMMNYPPLAHLLNVILEALNPIRECPIIRNRDKVLTVLEETMSRTCAMVVSYASTLRTRGSDTMQTHNSDLCSKKDETNSESRIAVDALDSLTLDQQYAHVLSDLFIPHVLKCYRICFSTAVGGAASEFTEELSTNLQDCAERCVCVLADANLLNTITTTINTKSKSKSTSSNNNHSIPSKATVNNLEKKD